MKVFKKIMLAFIIGVTVYAITYAWRAFPIISGYNAKILCSCTMLAGRDPQRVIENELNRFPLSIGSYEVHYADSSVSASVWGLARKKAVYRQGLGCTLVNGISEEALRSMKPQLALRPLINQDTVPWPMGNLVKDSLFENVGYQQIDAAVQEAFHEEGAEKLRRTRAVIIVYKGLIIAEQYAEGFDKYSLLTGWSMTKSLTNAITGLLIKEGKLKLHDPLAVKGWHKDARQKITLHHLLQASSGLAWEENYNGPSNATNMLFKEKDAGLYAAESSPEFEPGEFFEYSSGTSNIISWVIRQATGDSSYYRMPYEQIFYKAGMYSLIMEPDAGGTFVGSSFSFATARDWARFGLLYLHDGVWNGERILPEGWVAYSTTPATTAPQGKYGAHFWLNAGDAENTANRLYPQCPADMYWADGFEGQNVFIIPSKNLVIVKLSLTHGNYMDDDRFIADVVEAIK